MAQTTLKIRDYEGEEGPDWWQKYVRSLGPIPVLNSDVRMRLAAEYNLKVIQFNWKNPNSRAASIKGDEEDITMFLLKWS